METREQQFRQLVIKAHEAGMKAGQECIPAPMGVVDGGKVIEVVDDGVCGFAWIVVSPGTTAFARWLKKNNIAGKHYYGGLSIWVSSFGQSMTRKERYAHAYARVLNDAGYKAYAGSRMD